MPDPTELAWILAHHWREAGERRAGDRVPARGGRSRSRRAGDRRDVRPLHAGPRARGDRRGAAPRSVCAAALALAELEEYARADEELAALIPELEGRDQIEALLARARSTFWTEQAEETIALGAARHRAGAPSRRQRARGTGARPCWAGPYAMRGEEGDLDRAIEFGERALEIWVPGTRQLELAEHYHMHADNFYWAGGLRAGAGALAVRGRRREALDPHSAEFVLRGAGMEGLILAGMGRYEEALAAGEPAIATARRIGPGDNVVTNYSTIPLRDIFWLDEALERSATVAERLGPSDFNMPWMNARADVICADLLLGEIGDVERAWPRRVGRRAGVPWLGALADRRPARVGPRRCRAGGRPSRRRGDVGAARARGRAHDEAPQVRDRRR